MRYGKDRPAIFASTATAVEQPLAQVIAEAQARGTTTRLGVDLRLYSQQKKTYVPWTGMLWKTELTDVASGMRVAEGIDLLLRGLRAQPEIVMEHLRSMIAWAEGNHGTGTAAAAEQAAGEGGLHADAAAGQGGDVEPLLGDPASEAPSD